MGYAKVQFWVYYFQLIPLRFLQLSDTNVINDNAVSKIDNSLIQSQDIEELTKHQFRLELTFGYHMGVT